MWGQDGVTGRRVEHQEQKWFQSVCHTYCLQSRCISKKGRVGGDGEVSGGGVGSFIA